MLFPVIATVEPAVVGPDPITSPFDVPPSLLLRYPLVPSVSADLPLSHALVLEAGAGETVTVDLYVMDDSRAPLSFGDDPTIGIADRKFYLFQSALTLTANELETVTFPAIPGTVYVCPTADTLTATATIRGA